MKVLAIVNGRYSMDRNKAKVFCLTHKKPIFFSVRAAVVIGCELLIYDLTEEKPKSIAFTKDSFPEGGM